MVPSDCSNVRCAISSSSAAVGASRTGVRSPSRTTWRQRSSSLQSGRERGSAAAPRVRPCPAELELHRSADQVEARVDALPEHRRKLLRLEQHVLAHRHLAKVVKQRGEAQLTQLLGREANVAERAGVRALDGLGEAGGERGDAHRVAGRRRVAQIDRADGRLRRNSRACARSARRAWRSRSPPRPDSPASEQAEPRGPSTR